MSFAEVEDGILVASFTNEEDKERVLRNGPWLHLGSPILVAKWEAGKQQEDLFSEKIQLVVQVHDLPMEMRSEETGRRCAGVAGSVTEIIKPYQNSDHIVQRRRFYKFKVEVDLRKPLAPGCFLGKKEDNPAKARFRYEKLPNFCSQCGLFDHETSQCQNPARKSLIPYDRSIRADALFLDDIPAMSSTGNGSGSEGEESGGERRVSVETVGFPKEPRNPIEGEESAVHVPRTLEETTLMAQKGKEVRPVNLSKEEHIPAGLSNPILLGPGEAITAAGFLNGVKEAFGPEHILNPNTVLGRGKKAGSNRNILNRVSGPEMKRKRKQDDSERKLQKVAQKDLIEIEVKLLNGKDSRKDDTHADERMAEAETGSQSRQAQC